MSKNIHYLFVLLFLLAILLQACAPAARISNTLWNRSYWH
jgi:hypothetical protein